MADEGSTSTLSAGLFAADEYYYDGMTKFVFEEPGKLIVDASHGLAGFPVPTETLVFTSQEAYFEFMVRVFNAQIIYNPATGNPTVDLEVVTLGVPYMANETGTDLVEVADPVNTFLGGPLGYYLVGDRVICTDMARCPAACLPKEMNAEIAFDVNTASQVSLADFEAPALSLVDVGSLSSMSMQQSAKMTSSSIAAGTLAPFRVAGYASRQPVSNSPDFTITASASTRVVSGPLPYEVKWCGPPVIVEGPGGIMRVSFPQACSTTIAFPNVLMVWYDVYSIDEFWCSWKKTGSGVKSGLSVSRVQWTKSYSQEGGDATISGLKTENFGQLGGGTYNWDEACYGAGCFKKDPCN